MMFSQLDIEYWLIAITCIKGNTVRQIFQCVKSQLPVVFEAHVLDELHVLGVPVVTVAGHLGVGAPRDLARPLRPLVPDARGPPALIVPALDLLA